VQPATQAQWGQSQGGERSGRGAREGSATMAYVQHRYAGANPWSVLLEALGLGRGNSSSSSSSSNLKQQRTKQQQPKAAEDKAAAAAEAEVAAEAAAIAAAG